MTGRDRMVLIGIVVLAALGGVWVLLVSPERKEATKVSAQVAAAQTSLASAQGELTTARTAEASYPKAYAEIVSLGKAVPASEEVPSLIYQLNQATDQKHVEFASIVAGGGSGSSSSSSSSSSLAAAGGAFSAMPFTLVFNGTFFDLERAFHKLDSFAARTASGQIAATGRLLTIQSVKLSPQVTSGAPKGTENLTGTITATAYVLPGGQGVTGAATPTSPAGAATPAAATTPATSATPASATVKVTP